MRNIDQDPLVLQLPHGLPNGRPAHPEFMGQLFDIDVRSRGKPVIRDHFLDPVVDLLVQKPSFTSRFFDSSSIPGLRSSEEPLAPRVSCFMKPETLFMRIKAMVP